MLSKDITSCEYVVFDIETTGFDPIADQIIEIGAVKLNGQGEEIDRFQKFVSLYKKDSLPPKIVELTNITDEILEESGEDIDGVMADFFDFFEGAVLVAQNSKFDMSFIDQYYLKEQGEFLSNLTLDTIDLAKELYPGKSTYKLSSLIEYFSVEYDADSHHRADYDAYLTSQIFVKGMTKLYVDNKNVLSDYVNIFRLEEATINQKKYLHSLLVKENIILEGKTYLSKINASRQISILANNDDM